MFTFLQQEKHNNFCDTGKPVGASPVPEKCFFLDSFLLCCQSYFECEAHQMPGKRTETLPCQAGITLCPFGKRVNSIKTAYEGGNKIHIATH